MWASQQIDTAHIQIVIPALTARPNQETLQRSRYVLNGFSMPRPILPRLMAAPASRYAHGVVHSARARRLVISGQVGTRLDGSLAQGFEAQMEAAWDNITAILDEAGMNVTNLIKITIYVTEPDRTALYRTIRDRRLGGHLAAATYLQVAGLAHPDYLVEIEGEAVCEDNDLAFLDPSQDMRTERATPPLPPAGYDLPRATPSET